MAEEANTTAASTPSIICTVLPSFVRRRVGPIPSIRGTCSRYLSSIPQSQQPQPSIYRQLNSFDFLTSTETRRPPPSPLSSTSGSTTVADSSPLGSPRLSFDNDCQSHFPSDTDSGINWKFAYEGCSLLNRAVREASTLDQDSELTRKLYVDGLAYLIRGISSDLDDVEVAQLKQALPFEFEGSKQPQTELSLQQRADEENDITQPKLRRSFTYEAATKATFALLLLINMVLPYIRLLIAQACQYDRRYRLSERFIANGVNTGVELWRQTFIFVQEASNGVQDGLGQGSSDSEHRRSRTIDSPRKL